MAGKPNDAIDNLIGTFAAEGIELSNNTLVTIEKIRSGEISYEEAIEMLYKKYYKGDGR